MDIFPANMENYCSLCDGSKKSGELIKLKCNHQFCWMCLNDHLIENLNSKIKCPLDDCRAFIRDSEIRRVLSDEDIEQYENICLGKLKTSHKCLLPQCGLSVIYTDRDVQYSCENCTLYNCIQCQASHSFTSCSDYQSKSPNTKQRICQESYESAEKILNEKRKANFREMFLKIDEMDILSNDSIFECELCCLIIGKGDGINLQNCHDILCKNCLIKSIVEGKRIPVSCPYCEISLNDREIQSILTPDQFLNYQEMCRNHAKRFIKHFQCQTVDCDGFYEISDSMTEFICTKCKNKNCVPCRAVHPNETCDQYQIRNNKNSGLNPNEEQIKNDNKMMCLNCRNYIVKTKGCNWVQCPFCSTELCWIRKMLRWGPEVINKLHNFMLGRGDNSGGCRCMVDDIPCHPKCHSTCYPHVINFNDNPSNLEYQSLDPDILSLCLSDYYSTEYDTTESEEY